MLVAAPVFARPFTAEEKLTDFRGLVAQIQSGYGPLEYKKTRLGLDLPTLVAEFEAKISASTTNREFYYLVVEFIGRFKDGHFNASVPTTHKKELPFGVDYISGKVLIDWIDREKLPEAVFPFERGDEVVTFDGRPVDEVVSYLSRYVQSGNDRSIRRLATWALTIRRGARMPVPQDMQVGEVEIRHAKSNRVEKIPAGTLTWVESGVAMDEFAPAPSAERILTLRERNTDFDMLSVRKTYEDYIGATRLERSFACNPGTRIAIPAGATVIMNPPSGPFTAYYHWDDRFGGNVGYIRIPDYYPVNEDGSFAFEARFQQYEYAIEILQRETVGLVIDQDHNCGGSVEYLERMLGLFFPQPYEATQFQLLATRESYFDFKSWLDGLPPFTLERTRLEYVLDLIKTASDLGTSRLTARTSITGRVYYEPNAIVYTRPIVVLVDEIAGSGGDAFPGIMGYQRATLVGSGTSGLGGHVQETQPLYYSRLGGRMTKSLFYRADGVAVENNGAVPTLENQYYPSYADFVDGYRDYQNFYLGRLLSLIPKR
jgi:hypothetical protein